MTKKKLCRTVLNLSLEADFAIILKLFYKLDLYFFKIRWFSAVLSRVNSIYFNNAFCLIQYYLINFTDWFLTFLLTIPLPSFVVIS